MTPSQLLRQLAGRTGLDGFADELRAMADEMDGAAQAAPVAIYQSQGFDGMWQDLNKVCHDEYVKLGGGPVRVVYTAQPAAPTVQEPICKCGDRPASQCDEEWGPKCDLGNNPAHCKVSPVQQFSGGVEALTLATPKPEPMTDEQAARIAELEAEVNEQARLNGMGAERELALRADVERLQRAITEFCQSHNWAAESWKAEPSIQPLFDITRAIKAGKAPP